MGVYGCIISMLGSSTVLFSNFTASNVTTNESSGNLYARDTVLVIENSNFMDCDSASISSFIYV